MRTLFKLIIQKIRFRNVCKLGDRVKISRSSTFEGMNNVGADTHFDGSLGYGSYISAHCDMAMVKIGKFSSIAPRVVVNPGLHPYTYPFVTTCPAFYSLRKQNSGTFVESQEYEEFKLLESGYAVEIGSDCWIGEGVFISGGVTIGDGAVILAHSVVTKDIPPFAIVGGVPAKLIKYRFSKDDIDFLLKIKWWNRPVDWLKCNIEAIQNISLLKERI